MKDMSAGVIKYFIDDSELFFNELNLPVKGKIPSSFKISSVPSLRKESVKLKTEFNISEFFFIGSIKEKKRIVVSEFFDESYSVLESQYDNLLFFAIDLPWKIRFTRYELRRISSLISKSSCNPVILLFRYCFNKRVIITATEKINNICESGGDELMIRTAILPEIDFTSQGCGKSELFRKLKFRASDSNSTDSINEERMRLFFAGDILLVYEQVEDYLFKNQNFPSFDALDSIIGLSGIRAICLQFESFGEFLKDRRLFEFEQGHVEHYVKSSIAKFINDFKMEHKCEPPLKTVIQAHNRNGLLFLTENEMETVISSLRSKRNNYYKYWQTREIENLTKTKTVCPAVDDDKKGSETDESILPWEYIDVDENEIRSGKYDKIKLNSFYLDEAGAEPAEIKEFKNGTLKEIRNFGFDIKKLVKIVKIVMYEDLLPTKFSFNKVEYFNTAPEFLGVQSLMEYLKKDGFKMIFSDIGKISTHVCLNIRNQPSRARELLLFKSKLRDFEIINSIIMSKNPAYDNLLIIPAEFPKGEKVVLEFLKKSKNLLCLTVSSLFECIKSQDFKKFKQPLHRRNIQNASYRIAHAILKGCLNKYTIMKIESISTPEEFDRILVSHLSRILKISKHTSLPVFLKYHIQSDGNKITLQAIAKELSLTRERVRQIVNEIEILYRTTLPVSRQQLLSFIEHKPYKMLKSFLENLYIVFRKNDLRFKRYLNMLAGKQICFRDITPRLPYDYFSRTGQPISRKMIFKEINLSISNHFERTDSIVNEIFEQLCKKGRIRYDSENDRVYPMNLSMPSAVAYVLISAGRKGLSSNSIASIVNKMKISRYKIMRNDFGSISIHVLQKNPYVFLSGPNGQTNLYSHIKYLKLPDKAAKDSIMNQINSFLKGKKFQNLEIIYHSIRTNYNFYELRHIVKLYGKEYDISFFGFNRRNMIRKTRIHDFTVSRGQK